MKKQIRLIASMVIIILSFGLLKGQTYESRNYVKIPANREIIKTMKAEKCPELIDSGTVVRYETKKKLGNIEYTISKRDSLVNKKTYPFDKEINIKMQSLPGKANLTINEKDSSLILVNYWLNPKEVIKQGTTIHIHNRILGCDILMKDKDEKVLRYTLMKDTTIWLKRVYSNDTVQNWYKFSNLVLKTYEGETQTGLYANMYDRNAQYKLKLENREYISYPKCGWEFGALTIPIKYKFGYKKTNEVGVIIVNDEFIADLNIGAYGGYQIIGKHRLRMEGNMLRELTYVGFSLGGFLNLSTASLDSLNTTAGNVPFTWNKQSTIGVISPGIAAMLTVYNVKFGVFVGWDLPFGQNRNNWNYKDKLWIGLGFGYNLGGFWKK